MSILSPECRLLLVSLSDPESVVYVGNVVFSEVFRSLNDVLDLVN
jgi:hypothetical protein